jgi:DNA/RNA-binding domain of Phe-tRNA-synthetase-like protein
VASLFEVAENWKLAFPGAHTGVLVMKNVINSSGHDFDALQLPIRLDITKGNEVYTLMRGEVRQVRPGDMAISDGKGIIFNIICRISRSTSLFIPDDQMEMLQVFG